jgi:hypothetical protein
MEIIKGAIFLTTDNAQAQATLLLGQMETEPRSQAISSDGEASAVARRRIIAL